MSDKKDSQSLEYLSQMIAKFKYAKTEMDSIVLNANLNSQTAEQILDELIRRKTNLGEAIKELSDNVIELKLKLNAVL